MKELVDREATMNRGILGLQPHGVLRHKPRKETRPSEPLEWVRVLMFMVGI